MPKAKSLSDYEKGQINAFHQQGLSDRKIGRRIKRSHQLVAAFLKNPNGYGTKKRSGRQPKLFARDKS
uniref:Tc3 transposase DNA binding domain-containing protein n=1 Tax=Panagrolaimus davidi TaxID=227884 RepID=A0A914QSI0_9BILA